MSVSVLLQQIRQIVEDEFSSEHYLSFIYGSYAYGTQDIESDLDILMIGENVSADRIRRMTNAVIDVHQHHGMRVDAEVPYHRKLVATWDEVQLATVGGGFRRESDRLTATAITKTKSFLESEEIRLRLWLNAITGNSLFVAGDSDALAGIQLQARINWIRILALLLDRRTFSVRSFVDQLIGSGDQVGEWYLGFLDDPIRREYLENIFRRVFSHCVESERLRETDDSFEITDENWIRQLLTIGGIN